MNYRPPLGDDERDLEEKQCPKCGKPRGIPPITEPLICALFDDGKLSDDESCSFCGYKWKEFPDLSLKKQQD